MSLATGMMAGTLAVRVARRWPEARGIEAFELVHPEGQALPAFGAGAHVDVHLPGAIVRPYSICSAPHERWRYLLCVLREPASRGGSSALHDAVAEGDVLRIGHPRNLFALDPGARHHLLLAGGIGITPILSMAQQLVQTGGSFEVHYAVQERDRAALLGLLAGPGLAERSQLYCSAGDAPSRMDIAALLAQAPPGTHVYACGPARLVQAVQAAAAGQGWAPGRVHVELFAAPQAVRADGDAAFELVLARSGRVVPVAAGCSATEALAAAGVAVPTSCEQGVCGTCLVGVVSGLPDHRDLYLSPEEQQRNDQFLPCCSRALTERLVVDL
jgi:vanillate O-demethylase ferredoxin subunit